MAIDYEDQRLNDGLALLVQQHRPGKLSDFTAWVWDEVHLFHEWSEREFIEQTVGAPVIRSSLYESKASLLVFENDGTPAKAVGIPGDFLRGADQRVTWPVEVTLEPRGAGFLLLAMQGNGPS